MLNRVSFVIPSIREQIHTLSSIPDECEVRMSHASPLGLARNEGINLATRDFIILCDDDINFKLPFLQLVLELLADDEMRIVGLEADWPSPFVIGRFMAFRKAAWHEIGEFDIRKHGDESEWQYRALGLGYHIVRLSCDCVNHIEHEQVKPINEGFTWLYLCRRHPSFPFWLFGMVAKKYLYSSYRYEFWEESKD
jgi:glycosyltransferase involved in cell wall biosynthesis